MHDHDERTAAFVHPADPRFIERLAAELGAHIVVPPRSHEPLNPLVFSNPGTGTSDPGDHHGVR